MAALSSKPVPAMGEWLRRNQRAVLTVVAVALLWWVYRWWVSPEHRIRQFIRAVESNHVGALLRLADPAEVSRVHLTEEKLEGMLADATGSPGGVRLGQLRWGELNERQILYNRWGEVTLLDRQGHYLPDRHGHPARLMVEAYNTDAGWKIGITNFILGAIAAREGLKAMGWRYMVIASRHDVIPAVFNPSNGVWSSLTLPTGIPLSQPSTRERR